MGPSSMEKNCNVLCVFPLHYYVCTVAAQAVEMLFRCFKVRWAVRLISHHGLYMICHIKVIGVCSREILNNETKPSKGKIQLSMPVRGQLLY